MFRPVLQILLFSVFSFAKPVHAIDVPLDKQHDIRKLIELAVIHNLAKTDLPVELNRFEIPIQKVDVGATKYSSAHIHQLMREGSARIEKEAGRTMVEIMGAPGALVDLLIPIYDKYYEHHEIQELIVLLQAQAESPSKERTKAFMQTPLAQKLIMIDPLLTEESRKVSNAWRESHAFEIRRRIGLGLINIGARPRAALVAPCPIGENDTNYYPSRQLDVQPRIRGRVQPEFPKLADEKHISGSVQLEMKIDAYGLVQDIAIFNSTPPGVFDQSAMDAFSKATVQPACKDGVTVRSEMHIKIQYEPSPSSPSP